MPSSIVLLLKTIFHGEITFSLLCLPQYFCVCVYIYIYLKTSVSVSSKEDVLRDSTNSIVYLGRWSLKVVFLLTY